MNTIRMAERVGSMYKLPLTIASCALGMLALAPASSADEDLAAKRASCIDEAKDHIKAHGNVSPQLYELVVNRRKAYVATCMARTPVVQPPASPAQPRRAPRKRKS